MISVILHPELHNVHRGVHDLTSHAKEFHHLKVMLSGRVDLNIDVIHVRLDDDQFVVGFDIHPYSQDLAEEIRRIAFPLRTTVRPSR